MHVSIPSIQLVCDPDTRIVEAVCSAVSEETGQLIVVTVPGLTSDHLRCLGDQFLVAAQYVEDDESQLTETANFIIKDTTRGNK